MREVRAVLGWWCALVLAIGSVAAVRDSGPATVDLAAAGGAPASTTTTARPRPTTTAPTTTSTAPPTTAAPTTTGAPPATGTTAPPAPVDPPVADPERVPDPGPPAPSAPSVEAAGTGIYVLDLGSGAVRRLADVGPWALAGDRVLVGRGQLVEQVDVATGATSGYRQLPPSPVLAENAAHFGLDLGREAITAIEAAPDGTMLVTVFAPSTTYPTGSLGATRLIDPFGSVLSHDFAGHEFAVSDDGAIATTLSTNFRVFEPNGLPRASFTTPAAVFGLRWDPAGRSIVGRMGNDVVVVDTTTGAITSLGPMEGADIGPGGLVVGRAFHTNADGTTYGVLEAHRLGTGEVGVISNADGGVAALSDDGTMVATLRSPWPRNHIGRGEGLNSNLEIFDLAGNSLHRVAPPLGSSVDSGFGGIQSTGGPVWTPDGRSVVFAVTSDHV